ncbi:YfgM family protein [Saccharospirillum salsuginis]|uniref:Ancillary SecYEG translocon subunit n=1 Tax=Saccharospirillum salsuginis TaxID=418750 RepID=A0A918JZS4_9GAMM|nr:tetratricopeptide repeat protein [Saccharospirillum salsuginis]GGX38437.1 membrane protein [Saccharospirillum salsuginis]
MYDTEEEQIEAIKKWWNTYGNLVIGVLLAGLIAYFGWTFYQNSVQSKQEAASAVYSNLLDLAQDPESTFDERGALISTLKSEYSGTTYAVYAALQAAKDAVKQDNLDAAETELDWAIERADDSLKPVIQVRKARVQFANDQLDNALSTLDSIDVEGFEVAVNELRGDILSVQGQADAARSAYQTAFDASQEQGMDSRYLKMKLDDLASAAEEDNA